MKRVAVWGEGKYFLRKVWNLVIYLLVREERRLRVFENKVVFRTSGSKRGMEKVKIMKKFIICSLREISLRPTSDEVAGTCSTHAGDDKFVKNTSVGKSEGKKSYRRLRRRLEDNIKMDIEEIQCKSVDWIHLAQDMVQ
jgi:hypothetical protein